MPDAPLSPTLRKLGAGVGILVLGLLLLFGFERIDAYEVGVYKNVITGSVAEGVQDQGLYHAVLRDWTVYSLREQQYPAEGRAEVVEVLTADQLKLDIEAAFRWRVQPAGSRDLYLEVGDMAAVHEFVYNAYRSASRDAVAEIAAQDLLSRERQGIAQRIEQLMTEKIGDRAVQLTHFFVRDIDPPDRLKAVIEEKLSREQKVQTESYQTQVVREQANQRREEARGIRDAQNIISESLIGEQGLRYLNWRYFDVLKSAADGQNNMVVVPVTERGVPLFFSPGMNAGR